MIRPIDMSLTIQNAQEANRVGAQTVRPEVTSQLFADRLERQAKLDEQRVTTANQAEKGDVDADSKGQGGTYTPRRKKRKKTLPAPTAPPQHTGESLFDVRV